MIGSHYDVAIIGGGIIGGSIAFQLAKRNARVIVLEKGRIANEASSAAAGMLGAQSEFSNDHPLLSNESYPCQKCPSTPCFLPFALKGREMIVSLAEELKELTGIDIGLVQKGILKIALTEEEREALQRNDEFWKRMEQPAQWLSSDEVADVEPNVTKNLRGALYLPNDGQVGAPDLSHAFANASLVYGAEWREFTEVFDITKDGTSYRLHTNNGVVHAGAVVVAAGAWSARLLEKTGISLSMYPVKGECVLVKIEKPLIQATIFAKNGCYIVPKRGNRLLIGATSTPHTFDKKVTVEGMMSLLERAQQLLPDIRTAEWERAWAGIRPQTGDGVPYIGEHPHYPNIWIATGHYRNGILLSPITGGIVADLVEGKGSGEFDLAPFSLTRHQATYTT
ncbi:glycine oxidase [Anoxybacillus voinovskiensis]|uniref:glycine oxidase n=1 Tax=Anoxybacteroides voinovskiense TaxID=230470 RepID=A0A840DTG6_9BACL|nr:glycine oxidase ThiO [Anoxybacillus voinovskiensis]MBB4074832.1 glycine oxidase [Anoxybacillus voinovskiensis]GGJ73860.1 glycine oxidase ThiO [Anoxybacillus voinovskiensis]